MRWYERLYVGEKAKKFRYSVIQAVRERRPLGYYVLTSAVNEKNLLELYPAVTFSLPYYRDQDLLIVGVALDFEDAARLSARIIDEVYRKTGGFDVKAFLMGEG